MKSDKFGQLLDELESSSTTTLRFKNAKYGKEDRLHNFKAGADIIGGTPAQACWGYLTKHLVALRDMVDKNDFSDRADFLEKCQDSINYIRFLWCIGNEGVEQVSRQEEDLSKYGDIVIYDVMTGKTAYHYKKQHKPVLVDRDGYFTVYFELDGKEDSSDYSYSYYRYEKENK